jgi:SAM-dependent methyltransferase
MEEIELWGVFNAAFFGLEAAPNIHKSLNRNFEFSDTYSFESLLQNVDKEVITHLDVGTGLKSPCSQYVIDELDPEYTIGMDIHDYQNETNGHSHKVENPVYSIEEDGKELIQGDGTLIPLEDESVDLVTMGKLLNNDLGERKNEEALSEARRVLKPNGYLLGDIPFFRFVRPHEALASKSLGLRFIRGKLSRDRLHTYWDNKLDEYFDDVETGYGWNDEELRGYSQAIYFMAEKNPV